MTINKMADVARLLGVKMNEKFKIQNAEGKEMLPDEVRITGDGLIIDNCFGYSLNLGAIMLSLLLNGTYSISRSSWYPKRGEDFYVVTWREYGDGKIRLTVQQKSYWRGEAAALMFIDTNNCFSTYDEAEAQKYEVFKRLTGKEWDETYGKGGDGNV